MKNTIIIIIILVLVVGGFLYYKRKKRVFVRGKGTQGMGTGGKSKMEVELQFGTDKKITTIYNDGTALMKGDLSYELTDRFTRGDVRLVVQKNGATIKSIPFKDVAVCTSI